ncbi:uncharacterized protein LOC100902587 [Galendromus occidentalis]|uniref:Uncharacterized protein LOC100902587 n=1 Tax=Galendromus occidentalis TaxID=34638 RepID=A0AAJ6QS73_9ACAR|nr:uncharacterized protein LOC100902587 [Galendromus occidentalis]
MNNLFILNDGKTPTFSRGALQSFIDISLTNRPDLVEHWSVKELTEMISDHNAIEISFTTQKLTSEVHELPQRRWRAKDMSRPGFTSKLDAVCRAAWEESTTTDAKFVSDLLVDACNASNPHISNRIRGRKMVYWWTKDIGEARKRCHRARRLYVRSRKRAQQNPDRVEILRIAYKAARDSYHSEILKSKRQKWEELCDSVKKDVWGMPYKMIREKLSKRRLKIPREKMDRAIQEYIPEGGTPRKNRIPDRRDSNPENVGTRSKSCRGEARKWQGC